jgi:hypothetical protein
MKLVLEIDLEAGAVPADVTGEVGRILRYWAGNLKHYELVEGTSETLSDSTYALVGTWRIEGSRA